MDLSNERTFTIRTPMSADGGGDFQAGTVVKNSGTFTFERTTTIDHTTGTVIVRRRVIDNSPNA